MIMVVESEKKMKPFAVQIFRVCAALFMFASLALVPFASAGEPTSEHGSVDAGPRSKKHTFTFHRSLRVEDEARALSKLKDLAAPKGIAYRQRDGLPQWELSTAGTATNNDVASSAEKATLIAFVEANKALLPPKTIAVYEAVDALLGEGTYWCVRLFDEDAIVQKTDIQDARIITDPDTNMPMVSLTLTASGARRFELFTAEKRDYMRHGVDRLSIVLDDALIMEAVVQSEIPGGHVQISFGGSDREKNLIESEALMDILMTTP